MRIIAISQHECSELLKRLYIGRLGCALDNQPHIVPVYFSYEPDSIYIFSTLGKKIEWMRQNPKVCLQADEIVDRSDWLSVIVTGTYLELTWAEIYCSAGTCAGTTRAVFWMVANPSGGKARTNQRCVD